jgi:hypothetical protein
MSNGKPMFYRVGMGFRPMLMCPTTGDFGGDVIGLQIVANYAATQEVREVKMGAFLPLSGGSQGLF